MHYFKSGLLEVFLRFTTNLCVLCALISATNGKVGLTKETEESIVPTTVIPSTLLPETPVTTEILNLTTSAKEIDGGVGFKDQEVSKTDEQNNSVEHWMTFGDRLKGLVDKAFQQLLPTLLEVISEVELSSDCASAGLEFYLGIRSLKNWAIRMLDASGKLPAGILEGSLTDLGDYDECVDVVVKNKFSSVEQQDGGIKFRGQYCTLHLQPPLPPMPQQLGVRSSIFNISHIQDETLFADAAMTSHFLYAINFRIGICIPSSCNRKEAEQVAKRAVKDFGLEVSIPSCESKEPQRFSVDQIGLACFIMLIILLVLIATASDIYIRKNDVGIAASKVTAKMMDVLLAFSLYTNGRKLFNDRSCSDHISIIHGLRFITMAWVILAHTYFFNLSGAAGHMRNLLSYMDNISFQVIMNAWISVDTFFFIGGVALSYTMLRAMDTDPTGKINFVKLILRRYWRLAPPMLISVAFMILLPHTGSGPLWNESVGSESERCRKNWWGNALFISNWRWVDEICITTTWYLCADLQLYLLTILVLLPLYRKWPKAGIIANLLLIIISMASLAVITILMDLKPAGVSITPDVELARRMGYYIHWKPYTHLGPYCIGIATGYLIAKAPKLEIPTRLHIIGWISSLVLTLGALFGSYEWNRGKDPPRAVGIMYAATHRIAWASGLAWITYISSRGKGGVVGKILSSKYFVPLSRLTYAAYLVHPLVIFYQVGYSRQVTYTRNYELAYMYVGHLGITMVIAFFYALVFEFPFGSLENVLYSKQKIVISGNGNSSEISERWLQSTKNTTRSVDSFRGNATAARILHAQLHQDSNIMKPDVTSHLS